uniref:Disease resistance protein RGA3 n=1 Tax=Elaeis guineensis var. tenera TaxID=51953 RepID=A0A6I9REC4_ELAGV|nr:putative disease resistance protein RGA3 [Elaeis guineensis]
MAALTVGGAFLSASLQVVFDKLASPTLQEFGSLWGVKHELNRLRRTLLKILSIVEDTEMREIRDQSLKIWLKELKDAAYDADDILDEFEAEVLRQQVESGNQVRFLSSLNPNQVLLNRETSKKINAIRERLDDIAKDRDDLKLGELRDHARQVEAAERQESSSLFDESCMFGREQDKEDILEMLITDDSNQVGHRNVSALLIVGMAGLGKTTLAQLVYNDPRIDSHFDLKMWVHVSDDFSVRRITREIMESASKGRQSELVNWNMVQDNLKGQLPGNRYLLVLDDVWNEDRNQWEPIFLPLMYGERGSKILITTQNKNVANIMDMASSYCLEGLSNQDCWLIFKRIAFANKNSSEHPKLEEIGKEIVSKIRGLPLAAKILGGLLYSKLDEDSWRIILESEIWELPQNAKNILSALRLSYQQLPGHLKQCFAYCSLFPKEHKFEKSKLIQMWIAQGFVQPQGRRPIEHIASECFDDLLHRSFFQQVEESYFMHNLIHDLAQSVCLDECVKVGNGKMHRIAERALHLSLVSDNLEPIAFNNLRRFKRLRTLLFLHDCKSGFDHIPEDLFIKLKYLRVLDLSHNDIKDLPNSIGNLKHLRYLDVSYTSIAELPETIGNLHNMQTLKLEACQVRELPKSITKLINLRHLKANAESISTIAGIGRLTFLEELVKFKVHKEGGHKIVEIKDMLELQKIHISQLENVISREEAQKAWLNDKKHLHTLTLEWTYNRESHSIDELDGEVLEGLQPDKNLRELNIWYNASSRSPSWMRNHFLSNLEILRLQNCQKWEFLPSLGQLRFLRCLHISGMDAVKKVDHHFYGTEADGFPSLVELSFDEMPEWEEWSGTEGGQLFPSLRELLILSCPKLQRVPPLPCTLARLWIRKVGLVALPDLWGCQGIKPNSNSPSSLSSLEITECPKLTSLCDGFLRHNLRSLEQLSITDCPELVHSPEEGGLPALLSLKSLTMENCPKLTALLEDRLPLLAHLKIGGCPELRMGCLQNLTSLYSLSISDCLNVSSLPEETLFNLTALEELTVSGCRELAMLQFQALVSLKHLTVENCPMLESSSLLASSSLEYLEINNTPLAGLLHNLTSLSALRIHSCPEMTSFAREEEELQKLTSLQSLHIYDCVNLQFLPAALDRLTSLERLYLQNCPQIQSLPENGLPSSLNILDIRNCPMLQQRCRKHEGPDWPKIAHIPKLDVLTSSESHIANKTEEMLELLASISSDAAVAGIGVYDGILY